MSTVQKIINWISSPFKKSKHKQTVRTSHPSNADQVATDSKNEIQKLADAAVAESDSIPNYQVREKGIIAKVNSGATQIKRCQDAIAKQAENEYEKATDDFNKHTKKTPEKKARVRAILKENTQHDVQRRRAKLDPVQKKQKKKKQRAAEIEQDIYDMAAQLPEGKHTEKSFVSQRTLLIIGIVLLSCGEFSAVMNSLQLLGASPLIEIPLAISIVLILFVLAKAIVWVGKKAEILLDREGMQENIYDIFLGFIVLITLAFTISLSHLRIEYLECVLEKDVSWMTKALLYMLNPTLLAANVVLVTIYSNRAGDVRKIYSILLKKQKRILKEIDRLERKIRRIKLRYLSEFHRDKHNYLADVKAIEVDQVEELAEEVLKRATILNDIHSQTAQPLTAYFESNRSILEISRANIETKVGESAQWQDIEFTTDDTCYVHPFIKVEKEVEPQKSNNMKKLNGILHPVSVFILGIFLLGSCSTESFEGTDHAIIHLIDKTCLTDQQYHVTGDDIWELAEMEQNPMNGLEYTATSIADVSLTESHAIDIDPANELLSNGLIRNDKVESVRDSLNSLLKRVYPTDQGAYTQTEIFLPLREAFEKINEYPIETEICLIIQSDLIHNRGMLSLYDDDFSQEQDEALLRELNSIIPKGFDPNHSVEVIVLYKPNTTDDAIFRFGYNLIKDILEKNGIDVSLKANL